MVCGPVPALSWSYDGCRSRCVLRSVLSWPGCSSSPPPAPLHRRTDPQTHARGAGHHHHHFLCRLAVVGVAVFDGTASIGPTTPAPRRGPAGRLRLAATLAAAPAPAPPRHMCVPSAREARCDVILCCVLVDKPCALLSGVVCSAACNLRLTTHRLQPAVPAAAPHRRVLSSGASRTAPSETTDAVAVRLRRYGCRFLLWPPPAL